MQKIKQHLVFILFLSALLIGGGSVTANAAAWEGAPQGNLEPAHHSINGFCISYDHPEHGFMDKSI